MNLTSLKGFQNLVKLFIAGNIENSFAFNISGGSISTHIEKKI